MTFSDPTYLVFLTAAVLVVGLLPLGRSRLIGLIASSGAFLMLIRADWYMLPFVALVSYTGGIALQRMQNSLARFWLFILALCLLLAPLLIFKYVGPVWSFAALYLPNGSGDFAVEALRLPVGLSFYTFLAIGYLIEVYVENTAPETSPLRFAAMMSFFPMVTSGPIERAPHFLPQLANLGRPSYQIAVSGLRALMLGLLFKIVIADSLAPQVNLVFDSPGSFGATDLALANLYFAFQVYADFAGYSLIAIGSARLLGIELPVNFRQPYFSETVPEFWRRWHISLSSWFRDYVFMPLQFKTRRSGPMGIAVALVLTFVLVGVWHGAGLKYILFGLIHGIMVTGSTFTLSSRNRFWERYGVPRALRRTVRILVTFILVYLTLVLFRANDVATAWQYYLGLLQGFQPATIPLVLPLTVIVFAFAIDLIQEKGWPTIQNLKLRWAGYYLAAAALVCFTVLNVAGGSGDGQFIYFNF